MVIRGQLSVDDRMTIIGLDRKWKIEIDREEQELLYDLLGKKLGYLPRPLGSALDMLKPTRQQ